MVASEHNKTYNEKHQNDRPSSLLIKALKSFSYTYNSPALELGCGPGVDAGYLKERGFDVTAVDKDEGSEDYLARYGIPLTFACFEDFQFPSDYYALVNAQFSLPFVAREKFLDVFSKVKQSIRSEGVFVGNFLGVEDGWYGGKNEFIFLQKNQVQNLFDGFRIEHLYEVKRIGENLHGKEKIWHTYGVIAVKY